ncbi:unnamed protein product, partial [Iphiclides podalirius]
MTENKLEKEAPNNVIINVETKKRVHNIMTVDADGSVYVEESIENIQQEMAKQMQAIVTKNNTLTVLETEALVSTVQSDTENRDLNQKEVIPETTIQTDVCKIENKTDIVNNKTNILMVNDNGVESNIPQSVATTAESSSDILDASTEALKVTLENSEYKVETKDHDSVTIETNTAVNVDTENALPDLVDQTTNTPVPSPKTEIEKCDSPPKNEETKTLKQHTVITLNKTAHDKISSLLNDWEDNDSQQDECKNETALNSTEGIDVEIVKEVTPEKINFASNDNIKSLVSDWDDDDEDVK